jgi:Fe-S cluster assembly iron-binding protein IscA
MTCVRARHVAAGRVRDHTGARFPRRYAGEARRINDLRRWRMLALTSDAQQAIEALLSPEGIPEGSGLRIGPPDGIDGSEPGRLQVTLVSLPAEDDVVIDEGGARVFVDPAANHLLDDKVLDARIDGSEIQFAVAEQAG